MVRISIEVSNGAARFSVSVQAESIKWALEIVEGKNPGKECKVRFPIDAEAFFVEDGVVAKVEAVGMVA
jgi:regulation of enolase protein 1 (concanavalin A-like superfamily)